MAQWLRVLVVYPEDPTWFLAPIWQLTTTCYSGLSGCNISFWFPSRSVMYIMPHIHADKTPYMNRFNYQSAGGSELGGIDGVTDPLWDRAKSSQKEREAAEVGQPRFLLFQVARQSVLSAEGERGSASLLTGEEERLWPPFTGTWIRHERGRPPESWLQTGRKRKIKKTKQDRWRELLIPLPGNSPETAETWKCL